MSRRRASREDVAGEVSSKGVCGGKEHSESRGVNRRGCAVQGGGERNEKRMKQELEGQ